MTLVRYPDPRLFERCAPVRDFGPDLLAHLHAMHSFMKQAHPGNPQGGVGLAGPQVGDMRRLIVVDTGTPRFFANPEVFPYPGTNIEGGREGCLSFPDLPVSVPRYTRVALRWSDPVTGERLAEIFSGFEARVIQHEVDHLDGVTVWKHARPAQQRDFARRYA